MEPSQELEKQVAEANVVTVETLRKWADLFAKIPSVQFFWMSFKADENDEVFAIYMEDDSPSYLDNLFCIHMDLSPLSDNGDNIASINFRQGNVAIIEDDNQGRLTNPSLEKIGFFGFQGTWEEVTRKIIEGNNIVTQPAPPFTF